MAIAAKARKLVAIVIRVDDCGTVNAKQAAKHERAVLTGNCARRRPAIRTPGFGPLEGAHIEILCDKALLGAEGNRHPP